MNTPLPASLRAAEAIQSDGKTGPTHDTYESQKLAFARIITRETHLDECVECLRVWIKDSECYCANHVAVKSPCAYCLTKSLLTKLEQ